MSVMEALTKLVVGTSKFGDHLLSRKVSGAVVAALAFACGAGLVYAVHGEPRTLPAAPAFTSCGAPDLAEVSLRDTPAVGAVEAEAVFDEGRYENCAYGYSVDIPAGMLGVGSTLPAPQHGLVIDLDHPGSAAWLGRKDAPESSLSAHGSYNSLGWRRLDEAADDQLTYLRGKGVNARVQSRTTTRLAGLRAVRVVARYERGGEVWVSDDIVALRRWDDSGAVSILYTLDLDTPLSKYERDRPVLEGMQKSWCLQPVE
jgi:hypothetical protein